MVTVLDSIPPKYAACGLDGCTLERWHAGICQPPERSERRARVTPVRLTSDITPDVMSKREAAQLAAAIAASKLTALAGERELEQEVEVEVEMITPVAAAPPADRVLGRRSWAASGFQFNVRAGDASGLSGWVSRNAILKSGDEALIVQTVPPAPTNNAAVAALRQAAVGHCALNPRCVRGYRHGGKGGHCKLRGGPTDTTPGAQHGLAGAAADVLRLAGRKRPKGCDDEEDDLAASAAEAVRQAAADGLELERSERSATGFACVQRKGRRFEGRLYEGGEMTYLGTFTSPEGAALSVARARAAATSLTEDCSEASAGTRKLVMPKSETDPIDLNEIDGIEFRSQSSATFNAPPRPGEVRAGAAAESALDTAKSEAPLVLIDSIADELVPSGKRRRENGTELDPAAEAMR